MGSRSSKLSICIDIGTTSSAVAFCYRGGEITYVAGWPGQEAVRSYEQVPSALMYSSSGKLIACGAEVYTMEMIDGIKEHGHQLVERFKMHLHPEAVLPNSQRRVKPLPDHLTPLEVYTHFFNYLIDQTRRYLREETGSDPWLGVKDKVEILLTHPNRWGTPEQRILAEAVVAAGIMPQKDTSKRLSFMEESEAAASYCLINNRAINSKITVGTHFIICDAGGSTTDISAYKIHATKKGPTFLKEHTETFCLDAGGARVDDNLVQHLREQLQAPSDVDQKVVPVLIFDVLRNFQQVGKRKFLSATDDVQIGGWGLDLTNPPVKEGVYTLKGDQCEGWFRLSVHLIIQTMDPYVKNDTHPTFLILTGGFGESPYVRNELNRIFKDGHVILSNPSSGKAAAIGGLQLLTQGRGVFRMGDAERSR